MYNSVDYMRWYRLFHSVLPTPLPVRSLASSGQYYWGLLPQPKHEEGSTRDARVRNIWMIIRAITTPDVMILCGRMLMAEYHPTHPLVLRGHDEQKRWALAGGQKPVDEIKPTTSVIIIITNTYWYRIEWFLIPTWQCVGGGRRLYSEFEYLI